MPQNIRCTVDSCYYWDQGNQCLAKEIIVTSDESTSNDSGSMEEFSAEIGTTPVKMSKATCCKTFHDKSKGPGPVEKIGQTKS